MDRLGAPRQRRDVKVGWDESGEVRFVFSEAGRAWSAGRPRLASGALQEPRLVTSTALEHQTKTTQTTYACTALRAIDAHGWSGVGSGTACHGNR